MPTCRSWSPKIALRQAAVDGEATLSGPFTKLIAEPDVGASMDSRPEPT